MVRNFDTFISEKAIKPSSPTPLHLKTYNLSFADNFNSTFHIPLVFFYPYNGSSSSSTTITSHQEKAVQLLKKSLSQTLAQYYPFAGRLVSDKDGPYVDCNDEGVEFVEARVDAQLLEVVNPKCESLDHFFPTRSVMEPAYNGLVKVKLTYFDCGGLALGVSLSHKIGDTCTLYAFIKHWAAVSHMQYILYNNQPSVQPLPPHLIIYSEKSPCSEVIFEPVINKCVSKTFIFPNSKIQQVKAKSGIENPTRVEVVNSLLYLCAVRATKANKGSFFEEFSLLLPANLRPRLKEPLPETTVGNLSWFIPVVSENSDDLTMNLVIAQIKKGKAKLTGATISDLNLWQKEGLALYKYLPRKNDKKFSCTSLCGYSVYDVDFGWGNPIRVNFPDADDFFILMDTPNGDGIEAVVSLEEEDMARFQVDVQLLEVAFAA